MVRVSHGVLAGRLNNLPDRRHDVPQRVRLANLHCVLLGAGRRHVQWLDHLALPAADHLPESAIDSTDVNSSVHVRMVYVGFHGCSGICASSSLFHHALEVRISLHTNPASQSSYFKIPRPIVVSSHVSANSTLVRFTRLTIWKCLAKLRRQDS